MIQLFWILLIAGVGVGFTWLLTILVTILNPWLVLFLLMAFCTGMVSLLFGIRI